MKNINSNESNLPLFISIFITIAPSIFIYITNMQPCALCLVQRSSFALILLHIIFGKKYKILKKVAKGIALFIAFLGLYHLAIACEFIQGPSFCALNQTFFQKTLSACQDSPLIFIIGSIISAAVCYKKL